MGKKLIFLPKAYTRLILVFQRFALNLFELVFFQTEESKDGNRNEVTLIMQRRFFSSFSFTSICKV